MRQLVVDPGLQPVRNLIPNSAATAYTNSYPGFQADRWTAYTTFSLISGATDGPLGLLTTYARGVCTTSRNGLGFHLANNPESAFGGSNPSFLQNLRAGQPYTASIYGRCSSNVGMWGIGIRFYGSDSAYIGGTIWGVGGGATEQVAPNQWKRFVVSTIAPAGAIGASIYWRSDSINSIPVGTTFDATGFMVTPTAKVQDYADGSFPDWRWTGTPNASESVGYPYDLARIAGRPYAWFDAGKVLGDGVALPADNAIVSQWNDISGNGRHLTQLTPAQRPVFRSQNRNMLARGRSLGVDSNAFSYPNGASGTSDATMGAVKVAFSTGTPNNNGITICAFDPSGNPTVSTTSKIKPNTTYTALARVYVPAGTPDVQFSAQGSWVTSQISGVLTSLKDQWVDAAWTFTTDSDVTGSGSNLYVLNTSSSTAGQFFYIKRFALFEGTVPASEWAEGGLVLPGDMPVVQFDGVDDVLSTVLLDKTPEITMYSVLRSRQTLTDIDNRTVVWRASGGAWLRVDISNVHAAGVSPDGAFRNATLLAMAGTTWNVQAGVFGPLWKVALNGAPNPGIADYDGGVAPAIIQVGRGSGSAGSSIRPDIAAVLIFDRAHDDATRKRVERWLGTRYGIAVA